MITRNIFLLAIIGFLSYGSIANAQSSEALAPVQVCILANITPSFVTSLTADYPSGSWFSANSLIATVDPAGVVTGAGVGSTTISYTYSGPGCTTQIFYTTVNVITTPATVTISGPTNICSDNSSTITLSATPSCGVWSAAYGYVSIDASTGIVTGISIGKDIISYALSNSCGTSYSSYPIIAQGVIGDIYTVTGYGSNHYTNDYSQSITAKAGRVHGMFVDNSGDLIFCDQLDNTVRKIDNHGVIKTIAGDGYYTTPYYYGGFCGDGGAAIYCEMSWPRSVCSDNSGNIYVIDYLNVRIRKITPSGTITTIAGNGLTTTTPASLGDGGPALSATFSNPNGLAFDNGRNCLYVADWGNSRVRKIDIASNTITTLVGPPLLSSAQDVAYDDNNNLYIAAASAQQVLDYNITSSTLSVIAGTGSTGSTGDGGPASAATFNGYNPGRIAYDGFGNLYVGDGPRVRVINLNAAPAPLINAFAGSTATSSGAVGDRQSAISVGQFGAPAGLGIGLNGIIYIGDANSPADIRAVQTEGNISITPSGNATVCSSGAVFTSKVSVPGTVTYQWYKNGIAVGGAVSSSFNDYSPVTGNTYYCMISVTSPCNGSYNLTSQTTTVFVDPACRTAHTGGSTSAGNVSVNIATDEFAAIPNPNSGNIFVSGKVAGQTSGNLATIEVQDLTGKVIYSEKAIIDNGSIGKNISLGQNISNGLYLVKITTDAGSQVIKVSLQR